MDATTTELRKLRKEFREATELAQTWQQCRVELRLRLAQFLCPLKVGDKVGVTRSSAEWPRGLVLTLDKVDFWDLDTGAADRNPRFVLTFRFAGKLAVTLNEIRRDFKRVGP